MDAEGWASEVLAIKEQVMWLLTSDLLAADVPPIVGSRAGATGGTFTYALGHLRVSSIDVPRHKVLVVCGRDGSITVKATDISAHLQGFSWLYKQKGPPHLKDSGTADASMQGISLWLGINREQLNMGVYRRKHRPCSTGINTTDTRGTAASIKPGAIHLDSAATATSPAVATMHVMQFRWMQRVCQMQRATADDMYACGCCTCCCSHGCCNIAAG